MADNSTGLSLAGIIKWVLIISGFPCLVKAWQGIVGHLSTDGYDRYHTGELITGSDAVRFGWLNVLYAILCFAGAWAVWYFWQQNED